MNIVFWLGVLIAAFLLWYILSKHFFHIGSNVSNMVEDVKESIHQNEEQENSNNGE